LFIVCHDVLFDLLLSLPKAIASSGSEFRRNVTPALFMRVFFTCFILHTAINELGNLFLMLAC